MSARQAPHEKAPIIVSNISGIQGEDIEVKFNADGDGIGRYNIYQYQLVNNSAETSNSYKEPCDVIQKGKGEEKGDNKNITLSPTPRFWEGECSNRDTALVLK